MPALTTMLAAVLALAPAADDEPEGLRMSKPVVVAKIHGFADFELLPDATLTADDKLTVYYEPEGYAIEPTKDGYRALLVEDARLRKKGSKDALWDKAPMFEYEPRSPTPPYRLYMRTDMAIKALPPGEYELDLTLHDRLKKDARVTRTVAFKVVRPKGEDPPDEPKAEAPKAKPRRKR